MWEPMVYMRYTFTLRLMLTKHLSLGKGCVHLPPHMRKSMTSEYTVVLRALLMETRLNNPRVMLSPWYLQPRLDCGTTVWGILGLQCSDGCCQHLRDMRCAPTMPTRWMTALHARRASWSNVHPGGNCWRNFHQDFKDCKVMFVDQSILHQDLSCNFWS
jgi:hypothetical protein